jgi:hydrogenase-4 membrane subunit HyfE
MPASFPSPPLPVLAAAALWLSSVLLAIARRPRSALQWYRLAALLLAALAALLAKERHVPALFGLAALWLFVKVFLVPTVLLRTAPRELYSLAARGSPGLILAAGLVLVLATWTLGAPGLALACVLTPLACLAQRQELWFHALCLLQAELGAALLALDAGISPGWTELWAAVELAGLASVLAWFLRRARTVAAAGSSG